MNDVKIVKSVQGLEKYSSEMLIHFTDGSVFRMIHHQDCCESVSIEDIDGDEDDLVGGEWYGADERTQDDPSQEDGIGMWTFYTLNTSRGTVWIRWYGCSNGYYGIGVSADYADSEDELSKW